jgi:hypothetical protein
MATGALLSHVDTDLVTREQLALVQTPLATRSFKPVPHIELIETLEHVLKLNQITIRKEQFALRRDGATLFGVLNLAYQDTADGGAALGLRTSNNRTMSIQICAGLNVLVCDNMVFRGDLIALNRKHTAGLHLRTEINHAILRFQDHFGRLTSEIANLKERSVSDTDAKAQGNAHHHAHACHSGTRKIFRHDKRCSGGSPGSYLDNPLLRFDHETCNSESECGAFEGTRSAFHRCRGSPD